ncbi:hypothetical protein FACS189418_7940 [Clostridia bacterium]|nr:hypothetical protein FACS189418_7940 [Clostridia bacterium]
MKINSLQSLGIIVLIGLAFSGCTSEVPTNTSASVSSQSLEETKTTEESSSLDIDLSSTSESTIFEEESVGTSLLLYVSNEEMSGLKETEILVGEVSAEVIIQELVKGKILPASAKVLAFTLKETENLGILDLTGLETYGISGESLFLASLGNTFTKAFNVDKIRLLIDGENYASGHFEFGDDDYLTYNTQYKNLYNIE